jgi:HD-GYP domain-containing protein (c-di-GMP phosphodiesterase class II)
MILNTAVRESKSNSGCVILVDERNERLVAGASKGELPEDFDHLNSLPPQAVRDWIHFHENMQGPVQVGAGQDPARNVYHRLLEQSPGCELFCRALFQSASALSIPLKAKDRVIGALTLMRNQNAGDYQSRAIKGLIILASNAARAIENARLHNNLRSDYLNIIKALSNAVEAKDPYTRGHSDRVVRYTQAIGGALGLPVSDLEKLEVASILHDIGKIGISDQILLKPAGLSDDEYDLMKQHPIIGDRILQPINSLDEVRLWVYQHHERHDGLGYPEGLKGDNIEFQARILIVAEVFDALVTERAYKKAWPLPTVIDYLGDHASSHFDPDVVKIFCEILSKDGDDFAAYSQSNSFKLLSPDDLIQFFKDRP